MRESARGFTLLELVMSMAILAIVFAVFTSGFTVLSGRQESSQTQGSLRGLASAALDTVARDLVDSTPGYIDTTQRDAALGTPAGTASDVFEDTLFDAAHPRRQALNCSNSNGVLAACRALSATGTTGTAATPGSWLGATDQTGALALQGIALNRQMAPSSACPFCGSPLTPNLAYTDVVLFLSAHDVDRPDWRFTTSGSRPVYGGVVVYAPWIDTNGGGSLRRYSFPMSLIAAQATQTPGNVTLAQLMDADGDGVLFAAASPQTYDLGSVSDNHFVLSQSSSLPLNPGRPSIWWQKGPLSGDHVAFVIDRETGAVFWDIARQLPAGWFRSTSPASGSPRITRTLASGPGVGCCDFACTTIYSNAADPVSDTRRVRLTIAVGRSFASGSRSSDPTVVVDSVDVNVRN